MGMSGDQVARPCGVREVMKRFVALLQGPFDPVPGPDEPPRVNMEGPPVRFGYDTFRGRLAWAMVG